VQQQKDGVGEVQVVVIQARNLLCAWEIILYIITYIWKLLLFTQDTTQAQNLLASDPDGFSDPFVQIQVGDVIGRMHETLNPKP